MKDYRQKVRDIVDGLLDLHLPTEVDIESWSHFVTERQEWVDELSLLIDEEPALVHELLAGEFAEDLTGAVERVQHGLLQLKIEMSAVTQEMESARQVAVRVQQQKRSKQQEPGVLLGIG